MKKLAIIGITFLLLGLILMPHLNVETAKASTIKGILDEKVQTLLETSIEPVEVIITFNSDAGISENEKSILRNVGITKGVIFESLPMVGTVVTKSDVDRLLQQDEVLSIYYNEPVSFENSDSTDLTGVNRVRNDATFRQLNGGLPITGKNIGVVVNDSGVDGTHKDIQFGRTLIQNVLASINLNSLSALLPITYLENVPNTDSHSGHGTHVAGTVAGNGALSGGKYEGVAPGAKLIGYGSGAAVAMLDTLGGFDYALTHQQEYNIRIITNSWGATSDSGTDFDPNHPINIATKKLFDRGIITVFSAGNSGPNESTISGNYKKAPWVITVAAGDKSGNLADFSSRGVKGNGGTVTVDGEQYTWEDRPTVTAPGVDIISTRVISPLVLLGATKDLEYISIGHLPYYTTMSGTSMAAPHVAGIIALLLEANPNLNALEIKDILQKTASPMENREAWEVGAGYVNAYDAVELAFKYDQRKQKK
ncbi:S8 family serine peptidase [Sutcliffiella cohnii]